MYSTTRLLPTRLHVTMYTSCAARANEQRQSEVGMFRLVTTAKVLFTGEARGFTRGAEFLHGRLQRGLVAPDHPPRPRSAIRRALRAHPNTLATRLPRRQIAGTAAIGQFWWAKGLQGWQ